MYTVVDLLFELLQFIIVVIKIILLIKVLEHKENIVYISYIFTKSHI